MIRRMRANEIAEVTDVWYRSLIGSLAFMRPDQLRARYDALPRFVGLAQTLDPEGVFRNAFLKTYVFGED